MSSSARDYAAKLGIVENKDVIGNYLMHKFLKNWDYKKAYNRETFDLAVEKSYELLRLIQIRQGLVDNRNRDFHERPEEVLQWAEKALLREGLKGYFYNIPREQSLSNKVYNRLNLILNKPIIKFWWSTLIQRLPKKIDRPIPSELLSRILVDGIDMHFEQLKVYYEISGQNKVESRRRLREVFGHFTLFFSAMLSMHQLEINNKMQIELENKQKIEAQQAYEAMNRSLDELERAIDAI